jgi:nitrate reductase delta subunit
MISTAVKCTHKAFIGGHLKKNKSPYKVIFAALEALSKIKVNKFRVAEAIENSPKEPETLDELDDPYMK